VLDPSICYVQCELSIRLTSLLAGRGCLLGCLCIWSTSSSRLIGLLRDKGIWLGVNSSWAVVIWATLWCTLIRAKLLLLLVLLGGACCVSFDTGFIARYLSLCISCRCKVLLAWDAARYLDCLGVCSKGCRVKGKAYFQSISLTCRRDF